MVLALFINSKSLSFLKKFESFIKSSICFSQSLNVNPKMISTKISLSSSAFKKATLFFNRTTINLLAVVYLGSA